MAAWAAWTARFSPSALAVPIRARPMSDMTFLTSAKSRLISPGQLIRSEIPWIACRRTSSAILNDSWRGVFRSTKESRRWLGIVISVSTWSRSSRAARSA